MITITTNSDAVVLAVSEYRRQIPIAMVRAMNRAIGSGRTAIVKEMARDTGLKSKDVRDALVMREASIGRPVASLSAPLKRIPLIKFGARGPEPSRGRGRGVSYNLGAGGRRTLPHAFIATMGTGHRGVFMRRAKGRLPIRELQGPSLGHVFNKYREVGIARMEEAFVKNFDHELVFAGATPPPLPAESRGAA